MSVTNKSFWFHRDNKDEWQFIGIWADTLEYNNIKELLLKKIKEDELYKYFILFREYKTVVSILQKNLYRRNFCHRIKCSDEFSKNQKKIILEKENKKIPKSIEYLKYKERVQVLNVETGELLILSK